MSPVWKVLLALALVLPVGAYVGGSLLASNADEPARRDPIVVREPSPSSSPTGRPTATPTGGTTSPGDDRDDDRDDRDDPAIEIVNPEPGEVGEDDSGHGNAEDRDDDDRDDRDDRDDDGHDDDGHDDD